MADVEVKYKNKTLTTIRGMEARSIAKWAKEGWEFVSQTPAKLLRTTLTFRRPKKQISKWVWVAGAAAVIVLGIGVTIAAIQEGSNGTKQAAASTTVSVTPSLEPSPTATVEPSATATATVEPSATATATPVTDAEVVAAFQSFFAERASKGVMYGKAASKVTFASGIVRVIFDPAAAGVDQATFDGLAANFNLPNFAATPIAFNDEVGNRLRPAIDSIETVRVDGTSLGTIDAAGILVLNGLSK